MNNHGFSLIETLVVIVLMTIVVMIMSSTQPQGVIEKLTYDQKIIQNAIKYARVCAINNKSELKIDSKKLTVVCLKKVRYFPINSNITTNFPENKLNFNANGKLRQSGTIKIQNKQADTKITLNIGYGYES